MTETKQQAQQQQTTVANGVSTAQQPNYAPPIPGAFQYPMMPAQTTNKKFTYLFREGDREELHKDNKNNVILTITEKEDLVNRCVHKYPDGRSALDRYEVTPEGKTTKVICRECGTVIDLESASAKKCRDVVESLADGENILNFYKAITQNFDGEAVYDAMNGITYCKKVFTVLPRLLEQSERETERATRPQVPQYFNAGGSAFDTYNGILNGTYANSFRNPAMYQQQMMQSPVQAMGVPMGAPMGAPMGVPMGAPMGMPQQQVMQPQMQMAMGAPVVQQQMPMQYSNPFAEQPQQPQQQPQMVVSTDTFGG